MGKNTKIEWTETTWNPVTGCVKISPGCANCYAERMAHRTKRAERLLEQNSSLPWEPNIWMGVTVENSDYVHRIDCLRKTGAYVKFLSIEPLLGPIPKLDLTGIDWVIVGGESGPGARPMDPAWVIDIRDQCQRAGVPFFFKQWGGVQKKKAGRELAGRIWNEMPQVASAR